MDKRQLSDIKYKGRLIYFNINKNSKIYLRKNELLKISGEINKCNNFDEIVDKLKYNAFFVHVNYLLCANNIIKGYSMHFYKDAKTLKQLFDRPLSLKKNDCLEFQKAFDFMTDNKLHYSDVYLKNFMINSLGELLITDLESFRISNSADLTRINKKMTAVLSLSYLYNIEVNQIMALIKDYSKFLITGNNKLFEYFHDLNEERNIQELLDLISIDDIVANKEDLKRKSKILSKNEYFKIYYH